MTTMTLNVAKEFGLGYLVKQFSKVHLACYGWFDLSDKDEVNALAELLN